ncbi:alpha/beta hydrolase [Cryobacterium sp. GrIS_2_6]|uniref:alpha/beta hydrolase n=1 Tax=Cryobacterium sp. GrIS_2_6 TaxID=3162785 RepID=UPI002E01717C|nr:hypothetical protein [Cryobacterium psychrotolerans]
MHEYAVVSSDTDLGLQPVGLEPVVSIDGDVNSLRFLRGSSLLAGLARLSVADISSFVLDFPEQLDSLLAVPPAATEVTGWWTSLGGTERSSLIAAAPRLVGNLEGIPFRERGRANARYLNESITDTQQRLAGTLSDDDRTSATHELVILDQVRTALRQADAGPRRSLILLDSTGGGRAAIALGNPDTADYVGFLVPGMNYTVEAEIVHWTDTANALYREQEKVLAERAAQGAAQGAGQVHAGIATVAWIGYEVPDLFSVGGLDKAIVGADFLEKSSLGIRSDRGAHQPFISVYAHSYGSTVALTALARGSFDVDALVLVGSPGSQIQSAASLHVTGENVWVGKADWDPAVNSAFFGSDPGAESYGAHPLGVGGSTDRITGASLTASLGHNAYFEPGSESLHNMALIGTDNADLVTNGSE